MTNFDMGLDPVDVKILKKLIFCPQGSVTRMNTTYKQIWTKRAREQNMQKK